MATKVKDFDASIAFYTKVQGFSLGAQWGTGDERAALVDLGSGNHVELFSVGGTVLTIFGTALAIIGIAASASAGSTEYTVDSNGNKTGSPLGGAGGAMMGAGIPMLIGGSVMLKIRINKTRAYRWGLSNDCGQRSTGPQKWLSPRDFR